MAKGKNQYTFQEGKSMEQQFMSSEGNSIFKEFIDYIDGLCVTKESKKIYRDKFDLLLAYYSIADLCGGIYRIINLHSKGGDRYDPSDHSILTVLRHFARMLIEREGLDNLYIKYEKGYSSFVPSDKYISKYIIKNGSIEIYYNEGFNYLSSKKKTIVKDKLLNLFLFIRENRYYFASSNTAINTFHGVILKTDYVFGRQGGYNCVALFQAKDKQSEQTVQSVIAEYDKIIDDIVK